MNKEFDVVIAGAGMVGLTVAALLARGAHGDRLRLTVIDGGPEPAFDRGDDIGIRVSAISPGSARVLADAGIWDEVQSTRACPFASMRVWDADGSVDGPETLRFDAADFAVPELGHIVENSLIQGLLLRRLASAGVNIQFGTKIKNVRTAGDRFLVGLADGTSRRPELLIAADGSRSLVRRDARIKVSEWNYEQSAFVTHVRSERHHGSTAWQRFLQSGPLALLPLSDGRVSIVWSTTSNQAQWAVAANDGELGEKLTETSDGVLGRLTAHGPRGAFPLRALYAKQYVAPGLALVGDAAHSVHPLAGQGANLGLADAATLAVEIGAALEAGEYPGDLPALRRYERTRKSANQLMLRFIDGISRLFASEIGPVAGLRGKGMRLFNRSGPVRRQAIQVALGLRR